MALSHDKPSSRLVKRLVRLWPGALERANNDGLYPAMLAASNEGITRSTMYLLVRKRPHFVRSP